MMTKLNSYNFFYFIFTFFLLIFAKHKYYINFIPVRPGTHREC